jgi:hypothetical protein
MNKYSKYSILKSAIEDVFGSNAWYSLKESNHIPTWRGYIIKTLKAIKLSIHETIEIFDEDWLLELDEEIDWGIEASGKATEIDELISILAGTLIKVSFQQIGFIPRRGENKKETTLRKSSWKLNSCRSAVYLQTPEQKEHLFWSKQQNAIGFREQLKLHNEYKRSKSKKSYSQWCEDKKTT